MAVSCFDRNEGDLKNSVGIVVDMTFVITIKLVQNDILQQSLFLLFSKNQIASCMSNSFLIEDPKAHVDVNIVQSHFTCNKYNTALFSTAECLCSNKNWPKKFIFIGKTCRYTKQSSNTQSKTC